MKQHAIKASKLVGAIVLSASLLFGFSGVNAFGEAREVKTYEQLFPDPYFAELVAFYTGHNVYDIATQSDLDKITDLKTSTNDVLIVDSVFDLTGIGNLRNLESMDLSNMYIANVPDEIENLVALKTVDLSSNQIVHISENIGYLSNLEELHFDNNKIASFPR